MHRDPWITAEDRTKVFRLFGCSLWPPASRLPPLASGLLPIRRPQRGKMRLPRAERSAALGTLDVTLSPLQAWPYA